MDFRWATSADKEIIKSMWKDAFPTESEKYLDFYFNRLCSDSDTFLLRDGGNTPSSMQLIPFKMNFFEKRIDMRYLSGAATFSEFRGQGYMGELIKNAFGVLAQQGVPMITLIPATEQLRQYYSKFGFVDGFNLCVYEHEEAASVGECKNVEIVFDVKNVKTDRLDDAYRLLQKGIGLSIDRSPELWGKIIHEHIAVEGGGIATSPDGYAFFNKYGDNVVVKEIVSGDLAGETELLNKIHSTCDAKKLTYKKADSKTQTSDNRSVLNLAMGRILGVLPALEIICKNATKSFVLRVTDDVCAHNNVTFLISKDSVQKAQSECVPNSVVDISDLTRFCLGNEDTPLNGYFTPTCSYMNLMFN